jgi:uridine phosphorylase
VNHIEPIHLSPTATLAERVLLPGDPGRALALAQFLLEHPLMFNHRRGLWGYTGTAGDGEPLTIQSTGMGGPSAAIVLHELICLGVKRAIRVGTCGALDPTLALGDLVVAREAIAADGTSTALGAAQLAYADPALTEVLAREARALTLEADALAQEANALPPEADAPARTADHRYRAHRKGRIVSTDLFYERDPMRNAGWRSEGALAVEMEAATLFAMGANAGIQVACLLTVSDNLHTDIQPKGYNPVFDELKAHARIEDHALTQAAEAMGRVAAAALSV